MAQKSTFIMLDRNILDWRWYKDSNTLRVFLHLLLKANIKEHSFENITVKRGQLVTSRKSLASELGLSERNIRTALSHLISTNEVTTRPTSKFTIITVVNYEKYQSVTNQQINDRPTSDQRVTTIKKRNNVINNNIEQNSTEYVIQIINYLNQKAHTHYKPSTKSTQKHINARLNEGYTVENFKTVIDNKCSQWLSDTNMRKYLRPETLFGSKFESYLNENIQPVTHNEFAGYDLIQRRD